MGLLEKIAAKEAVYGVVGLGYVGLPLAVEMAKEDYRVIGFEVDADRAAAVNAGESYIQDISSTELAPFTSQGRIEATTDFARAAECDVIAICVPTPLNEMREPDITFIADATRAIAPHLTSETLVTLESTTYPGTTDEIIKPILEEAGHAVGADIYLAFSPERVDPGNTVHTTKNTPKVVGGHTSTCSAVAVAFYESFLDTVVSVSSTKAAELSKLLENIFRCVNIALVNELVQLCERMDINMWEVVDAAKTKPFGFMGFYPGPGLGGHCIPVDPFYLSWKAREYDFRTQFIELAGLVNGDMPYYVEQRVMEALNEQKKALNGSRILVLGVAYKANIDDMRESPAISVIDLLRERGAEVRYHDPFVGEYLQAGEAVRSVALTPEEVAAADCVLVLTAHDGVDYEMVRGNASLIFDTRNVYEGHASDTIHIL
ncbi:MAG: nucleotide sugar dehydrogenase [Coriobacteriia bacterium]|nr:nucleotide sugar dehydrogenase [Coriobacteriia bacterium]